ncbi:hypothetical protein [Agrobacterium sp. NPDC089420]|uniref:hypothetical protein n=1 Tax=Agrobacterium sp. NPDC089420 TaxID=3363918 RepID=UPI00384D161C
MTIIRIRELNDVFRTTWLTGTTLFTSSVQNLPDITQSRIVEAFQGFGRTPKGSIFRAD